MGWAAGWTMAITDALPFIHVPVWVSDTISAQPEAAPVPLSAFASSSGEKAKYKPVPPIPRKGQPARANHCQAAAFKAGHRSALTAATVKYLAALNMAVDALVQ
jgi:hypothetical protein